MEEAPLLLWRRCGGPIDEVPVLIQVLMQAELLHRGVGHLVLSRAGQRITRQGDIQSRRSLALALLRAGLFHDQARTLIESGTTTAEGAIVCAMRDARRNAPQLVGLLEGWANATPSTLALPLDLVRELTAVWTLLPPPGVDEAAEAARKTVGNRAELYSYQFERLKAETPSDIVWVSRDDESLGYDIEDRSANPRRRIEVKGSGGDTVRFFLSENEWRKAHEDPVHYEIHFWGGIDPNQHVAQEFERLRANGYPHILVDLPSLLATGELAAVPQQWKVERSAP